MPIHGKDLRTFQFRQGEVIFCKSLVLCDIHGNELRQIDLITGAPHGVNPSSLNLLVCAYTWGGFTYFSLKTNWTGFYSH